MVNILNTRATNKETMEEIEFTELEYLAIVGQHTIYMWNDVSVKEEDLPNEDKAPEYYSSAIRQILRIRGLNPDDYIVS